MKGKKKYSLDEEKIFVIGQVKKAENLLCLIFDVGMSLLTKKVVLRTGGRTPSRTPHLFFDLLPFPSPPLVDLGNVCLLKESTIIMTSLFQLLESNRIVASFKYLEV